MEKTQLRRGAEPSEDPSARRYGAAAWRRD